MQGHGLGWDDLPLACLGRGKNKQVWGVWDSGLQERRLWGLDREPWLYRAGGCVSVITRYMLQATAPAPHGL